MATKKDAMDFSKLAETMNNEGFEELTLDTMAIPFMRIVQELSPQMKKSKPEYDPNAEEGMFVNSVNGKLYTPPIRVVIGKFQHIFLEWGAVRGQLMGVHSPEAVANKNFLRNDKNKLVDPTTGHIFDECYSYYALNVDEPEEGVFIIACMSTNIKEAKKLNRNLMHTLIPGTNKRALPYFMVWEVSTVDMSNDQGDWKGIKFKFDSFVTKEMLSHITKEREALPDRQVEYKMIEDNAENYAEKEKVPY